MIPLSVPNLNGNEWNYIKECLDTNWVSSVGSFVNKFEKELSDFTGSKYAISTVNGTAALHISMLLSGVEQDDYVIVPNITFIASANAIVYLKARPIFIDIDPQTWQMDLGLLEEFLMNHTEVVDSVCYHKQNKKVIRCIMPVHVLGNMCDMDRLMAISKKFALTMVEDATESLGSYYKGKHSGTFGLFGCVSFNGNKIITTGGGGMILTNDEHLAKKAKHITTQAKSDPFEYIHDEIGFNYRLVNILAAMGVAQMEQLPAFLIRKKQLAERYKTELKNIPGFNSQLITPDVSQNNWLLTYRFDRAGELIKYLIDRNIQVRPFWVPMNQLVMFKDDIYYTKNDRSGNVYKNCISLPCSTNLTDEEQLTVITAIKNFYNA
jgi:perosamine synthetase